EIRQALRDAPDVRPAHIFAGMPHVFRAERASDVRATFQFDITGEHGGAWTVRIGDGRCGVTEGVADSYDAFIGCDARTFLDLVFATIRPGEAFVDGKLRVAGDLALAMRFSKVMGG
ncbi:MAG: SCP2 sterol-binding domain-containing protein, partial [Actinomycetota bacterium]